MSFIFYPVVSVYISMDFLRQKPIPTLRWAIGAGFCTETCCVWFVEPPPPEDRCGCKVRGADTMDLDVVGAGIHVCLNPPGMVMVPG